MGETTLFFGEGVATTDPLIWHPILPMYLVTNLLFANLLAPTWPEAI